MSAKNPSLYRAMHHLRKGGLYKALNISQDETIPADRLEEAKNSKNTHVAHMAKLRSLKG